MYELDKTIAEMYPTMKTYLPRLSSYLMNLYLDEPQKQCQKHLHQYVKLILFTFSNFLRYEEDLSAAHNYAYECLSQEEFLNKDYLEFKDGKLYDKKYSPEYISYLIQDAVISFEIPIQELQKTSSAQTETLINYILNIIDDISEKTDIDGDLYCAEYIEQCFLSSLSYSLETFFEYQDSLNNK